MENRKVKLKVENIGKDFFVGEDTFTVIDRISFEVYENEFLVLLGPGLCGKTTLLNIISGIEDSTRGKIYLDEKEINGTHKKIGMVFQKLGLLQWKTVMENTEIGPKFAGISKVERRKIAKKYLDLVGLLGFENYFPYQLSGGMKQRVGIARAYTNDPDVLLLDEPFGQLDAQTRYSMQEELLTITKKLMKTIVFVTNNIEEAIYLGDRIILLSKCPAKIKTIFRINFSHPRNVMDLEFLKIRSEISDNMELSN